MYKRQVSNYSRGLGVLDLAYAIEHKQPNRASAELARHITEVIGGIITAAQEHCVYKMTTSCEIPKPIEPLSLIHILIRIIFGFILPLDSS